MTLKTIKNHAEKSFLSKEYDQALRWYSMGLVQKPHNKELKIGALLCDLARDMEDEAHAMFDYFLIAKHENKGQAEEMMEQMIASIDQNISVVADVLSKLTQPQEHLEKGITYDDFLSFAKEKESFKEAFEDVIFSTKVILRSKDEFYSFLELLVDNSYNEMALSYLESAGSMFPLDDRIRKLLDKITDLPADKIKDMV